MLGKKISENLPRRIDDPGCHVTNVNANSDLNADRPQEEDMEVPEIVEEIIELLLSGLKDTVC